MDLTEELFSTIATEVCGSPIITYQGTELDLTRASGSASLPRIAERSAGTPRNSITTSTRYSPTSANAGKRSQDGQARQAAGQL